MYVSKKIDGIDRRISRHKKTFGLFYSANTTATMQNFYLRVDAVLLNVENTPTAPLLKSLNDAIEILYEKHGFRQLQSCLSYFLYHLLAHQRPIGRGQRWEKENLGRDIAQMPCMQHFLFREHKWTQLRADLLYNLDTNVWDGEMHLASIDDFLDELENELKRQKRRFYETCRERCRMYKEELIAEAMHPRRVAKILDAVGFEGLMAQFG